VSVRRRLVSLFLILKALLKLLLVGRVRWDGPSYSPKIIYQDGPIFERWCCLYYCRAILHSLDQLAYKANFLIFIIKCLLVNLKKPWHRAVQKSMHQENRVGLAQLALFFVYTPHLNWYFVSSLKLIDVKDEPLVADELV
jgi:hypothetical protein